MKTPNRGRGVPSKIVMASALGFVPFCASAESNVTIYGLFDIGLVKRSDRGAAMERGNNNRLGFTGKEDLGDGLSATFKMEARFNPDTGEPERPRMFWQGETTVGLSSTTLGSMRIGRALTPMWQKNWKFEPWGATGRNASLNAFQVGNFTYSSDGTHDAELGSANFSRFSDAIFYNSPDINGFSLTVAGQGERLDGARARGRGFSLNYDKGPVSLMLAGESNTDRDRIGFFGASYVLGSAKLMGSYARIKHREGETESSYVVAGTYDLAVGTLRGGYGRDPDVDASRISIGYIYPLSKRTHIYVDGWRHETASGSYKATALGISHRF